MFFGCYWNGKSFNVFAMFGTTIETTTVRRHVGLKARSSTRNDLQLLQVSQVCSITRHSFAATPKGWSSTVGGLFLPVRYRGPSATALLDREAGAELGPESCWLMSQFFLVSPKILKDFVITIVSLSLDTVCFDVFWLLFSLSKLLILDSFRSPGYRGCAAPGHGEMGAGTHQLANR